MSRGGGAEGSRVAEKDLEEGGRRWQPPSRTSVDVRSSADRASYRRRQRASERSHLAVLGGAEHLSSSGTRTPTVSIAFERHGTE
jgi:hypothetical protein